MSPSLTPIARESPICAGACHFSGYNTPVVFTRGDHPFSPIGGRPFAGDREPLAGVGAQGTGLKSRCWRPFRAGLAPPSAVCLRRRRAGKTWPSPKQLV